jgi:phosphoglycerate dehydrogenase-like enzyme
MRIALTADNQEKMELVFGPEQRARIAALATGAPIALRRAMLADAPCDAEIIFSTWGMPCFTPAELDRLPRLRAVFYAAGTVKAFAPPLFARGVLIASAWQANAVPVAEFCLAQILLGLKGYFRNVRAWRSRQAAWWSCDRGRGAYGATVVLVGYGQVARRLRGLLRQHAVRVVVVDPYLAPADAAAEDVVVADLAAACAQADVLSNHLPDLPELHHYFRREHIAALPPGALFLNTGRGAQVVEAELAAVLAERGDLTAVLDVTLPEPPDHDGALARLPNCIISTHIAGSVHDECRRMADWMIDACSAWSRGEPLRYGVTPELMARMA